MTPPTRIEAAAGPAPIVRWLRAHAPANAHLRLDSRQVEPGDVFLAVAGRRTDGAKYVDAALARGAAAVVMDAEQDAADAADAGVPMLAVPGLRTTLGALGAAYYDNPTAALCTIGITGTNGKTSSCIWLAQVLEAAGRRCATLGTLGFGLAGVLRTGDSALTTPDALSVQRLAREALDAGAQALAMEVSSIGLDQGRVEGVQFAVALFTNLTRDHLDYHPDMAAYAAAKRRLFVWPGLRAAVINLDDAFGRALAGELAGERGGEMDGERSAPAAGERPVLFGVGTRPLGMAERAALRLEAYLWARAITHRSQGLHFTLVCERGAFAETVAMDTALLGEFNVSNVLGVIGAALACGVSLADAAAAAARLQAPPGRLQRVTSEADALSEPLTVVDYAHSPDAITKALLALRPLADARGGRLWIVFGAGGDRDRGKRPAMAAAAAAAADAIVLTSDNPRSEDAAAIIEEIAAGIPAGRAAVREVDRGAGIRAAVRAAANRDVVLIAGKGHENYQEIAGQRLPFSDVTAAHAALDARREAQA